MQLLLGWHNDLSTVGIQPLFATPREKSLLATMMSQLMREHITTVSTTVSFNFFIF
jgi:hypothetical protein